MPVALQLETVPSTPCVVAAVLPLQKHMKHGEFLWELLYPKDKDGLPGRSSSGRYKVKLFILVSASHAVQQRQQL